MFPISLIFSFLFTVTSDNKVLSCGDSYQKQLGRSTESDSDAVAREIEMPGEIDGEYTVSAILSSGNWTLVVIELSDSSSSSEWTQQLVVWGFAGYGNLGIGKVSGDSTLPVINSFFSERRLAIEEIICSQLSTVVTTDKGKRAWGFGYDLFSDEYKQFTPREMELGGKRVRSTLMVPEWGRGEWHWLYPREFRDAAFTLMLMTKRLPLRFPKDISLKVIGHLSAQYRL